MALRPRLAVAAQPRVGRIGRRPQHRFQLQTKPWQIQPFMIAPVLPGETMKNALLQARVVSAPIKHSLVGWWSEFYFFYVKHRDLAEREMLTEMMLDKDKDMSSLFTPADPKYYHMGGTIPWLKLCTTRIVEEYFRNEGEEPGDFMIDGMYAGQINDKSWLDSVVPESHYTELDVDVDADGDGKITASEMSDAMRTYEFMRHHGMTEMDYEDYLATFGIRTPAVELHRPELLRYVRDWTYPNNTVDPATGSPSTAAVWSHTERLDKDRFFREPGFIVGLSIVRPKVYLRKQAGSCTGVLTDAFSWLPAIMRDDPRTSMTHVPAAAGLLKGAGEDFFVDVRDLFLHGEQFANFDVDVGGISGVSLPAPNFQKMYPSLADADDLFAGEKKVIDIDGIVTLNVLGTQRDQTATTNGPFTV